MIGQLWRWSANRCGPAGRIREIGSVEGLPALSLDALTAVAYGPEAILLVTRP